MGNLGHQAARAAASKIIDIILKGLDKDREAEVCKLIDLMEKYMENFAIPYTIRNIPYTLHMVLSPSWGHIIRITPIAIRPAVTTLYAFFTRDKLCIEHPLPIIL